MTYEDALNTISSLMRFGSKPGLERINKLLKLLGNPQDKLKFVHVAGTNGKGSTCALISSVLKKAKYKTGMFTSPYVSDFCERMQINGEMISHEELIELVKTTFPYVQEMAENNEIITEFEFITAMAMQWFAKKHCDIVVLEVGLGGRFDATNTIKTPLVSVITSISLDHTQILGDTVEEIAFEKCGIIKENGITVCYPDQPKGAFNVIKSIAEERHNKFILSDEKSVKVLSTNITGTGLEYRGLLVKVPFIGEHQIKNAVTALYALEVLKQIGYRISDHSIEAGFACAAFPARLEILSTNPYIIIDGAHNPDGTLMLANSIKKYFPDKKIIGVVGMLADKDIYTATENFKGVFSKVITVTPNNPRAMSAQNLCDFFVKLKTESEPAYDIDEALKKGISMIDENAVLIVCGSLYVAGDARIRLIKMLNIK